MLVYLPFIELHSSERQYDNNKINKIIFYNIMTKNINYVSHKKSKVKSNGKPQLPSANSLVEGEIAINYAEDVETLSIKNESGTVVTFSSDNYYTEQKLGSGFTGSNSAKTVTDVIEENEETVSAALNDLEDTKVDKDIEMGHYNTLNSGLTILAGVVAVIKDEVSGKTDTSAFTEHTSNSNLHFSGNEKENLDALTTNIAAISGITADNIDSWNAAAGQDLTQYYKKTETSGATELSTAFGNKADSSDLVSLSGTVTAHTADTTIHVTTDDKSKWNNVDNKLNTSDFNTYSGAVDTAIGNKVDKVSGKDLSSNDFTDALKTKLDNIASGAEVNVQADWTETATTADSYIQNKPTLGTAAAKGVSTGITNSDNLIEAKHIYSGVGVTVAYDSESHYIQLKNTAGSVLSSFDASTFLVDGMVDSVTLETKSGSTYLVITWNTAAGKTKTELNIGDIFEADNYYTTAQTDTAIEAATSGKVDTTTFTAHTASTVHMTTTEKTNLDSLETNIAAISGITSTKVSNWDGAATDSHTHSNKTVLDGISSDDIINWNSKTSNVGTVTSVQIGLPTGLSAATTAITESGKFDVKFSDGYSIPTTLKQGQWDEAYTAKHSHDNKTVLDGITTAKTSSWDTAATSAHNHSNKSTLDAITASSAAINSLTGAVGTMAFQNTSSYSSATQVQTALGKKSDTGHTHVKADITDFPTINNGTFTISGNGASVVSTSANASANKGLNIKSSTNVTITTGASEITIAATDTTYTAGSFVTITGSNNSINVTTGTTSSSVSRGDHNHDAVYTKITDSEAMEQTLAAAITDIDSRAADKEELKALVNDYQDFKLMYENRRERKRFTNRDDFVARLKMAAADQNLERYGLKVGDYYTTTNGGKTYNYVIAGLNTMKGTHSYRLTTDHVGIIVDTNDTHAWNVSGNTYQSTNTYSTGGTWKTGASAAGYANCDLHYYLTTTVLPYVEADLGSANIKSHYKLYSTAVNTSGYNRFGSAGGCSSSWAWYAGQKICALSEIQVYGSIVWSSSGYDTGEACRQLDVFRVYNMNEIFEGRYPWLRDVASASNACHVGYHGYADTTAASYAHYVAALILFA